MFDCSYFFLFLLLLTTTTTAITFTTNTSFYLGRVDVISGQCDNFFFVIIISDNVDLGTACGKYFRVCCLSIIDPGTWEGCYFPILYFGCHLDSCSDCGSIDLFFR